MKRQVYALALLTVSFSGAQAACSDPPSPKVNWANCRFFDANLAQKDLSGANLKYSTFNNAYMMRTNLSGTTMANTQLESARMGSANPTNADLTKADLENADLTEANLVGAKFWGADIVVDRSLACYSATRA